MGSSAQIVEVPWVQGTKSGVVRVGPAEGGCVHIDAGMYGRCAIPKAALKRLIVGLLEEAKKFDPPPSWKEAEKHFAKWPPNADKRLRKEFRSFAEVFVYLSAFEYDRTDRAIRHRLQAIAPSDLWHDRPSELPP